MLKDVGDITKERRRGCLIEYENDCVSCDIYCANCGLKHNPHYYCDKCEDECDELYNYEGQELCEECLKEETEAKCDRCGDTTELYEYDGMKLCITCLLNKMPKVERT